MAIQTSVTANKEEEEEEEEEEEDCFEYQGYTVTHEIHAVRNMLNRNGLTMSVIVDRDIDVSTI